MKLLLSPKHVEALSAEARRALPEECCGLLLGTREPDVLHVKEIIPVPNVWEGPHADRYMLEPRALLRAERTAAAAGNEVLGFFHSHPNGRAEPSAFDAELAWPEYAYVVIPVDQTAVHPPRCWVMPAEDHPFVEQPVEIRNA